jgi:hypothetical protein
MKPRATTPEPIDLKPTLTDTVHEPDRVTLYDAHGRRVDRGIGFQTRYIRRDAVPHVRIPPE